MKLAPLLQEWVDARTRHHLSHAHVQMARELGLNPQRLGSLDERDDEHRKVPLPKLIERLYEERFGRARPLVVITIEERARQNAARTAAATTSSPADAADAASPPPSKLYAESGIHQRGRRDLVDDAPIDGSEDELRKAWADEGWVGPLSRRKG